MCAVSNMAVFCSSLTACFPGMLLTYFLNDFEIVPVAPIITGITFVFTFHTRCISNVRSLYFRIFSVSILITFLSPEIATSINIHVPFSLSRIIIYCYHHNHHYHHHQHHHHHHLFAVRGGVIPLIVNFNVWVVSFMAWPPYPDKKWIWDGVRPKASLDTLQKRKSLAFAKYRNTVPRLTSPFSSHYSDWTITRSALRKCLDMWQGMK